MAYLQLNTTVAAPRREVFKAFSDFPNAASHVEGIDQIEMLTEGPVGVGTRFKETRTMFGRQATETMEVTDFVPDEKYTLSATSCGCQFDSHFRFSDAGNDRTDVQCEMESRPLSFGARLMAPLMGLMMKKTMQKCMQEDIDQIRERCEQQTQATAPTSPPAS